MKTPAAPAAPTQSTPAPSSNAPVAGNAPQSAEPQAISGDSRPRGPDGKFLPKAGEVAPPAPEPTAAEKRKFRLKVRGQEAEYDEDRVREFAEIGAAGKHIFTEIEQARRQFEEVKARAKTNPELLFRELGVDPSEWAQRHVLSRWEEESLTPEQKQAKHIQVERELLEAEKQAWQQQQQQHEVERYQAQILPILQSAIPQAMEELGLPHIAPVTDSLSAYLREAINAGKEITPELVRRGAELAKEELSETLSAVTKGMTGAQLVKLLGPEALKEVRRHDYEEHLKKKAAMGQAQTAAKPVETQAPPRMVPMLSERELRERLKGK